MTEQQAAAAPAAAACRAGRRATSHAGRAGDGGQPRLAGRHALARRPRRDGRDAGRGPVAVAARQRGGAVPARASRSSPTTPRCGGGSSGSSASRSRRAAWERFGRAQIVVRLAGDDGAHQPVGGRREPGDHLLPVPRLDRGAAAARTPAASSTSRIAPLLVGAGRRPRVRRRRSRTSLRLHAAALSRSGSTSSPCSFFFGAACYVLAYFCMAIARRLRRRENEVAGLYDSLRELTATLDLQTVLNQFVESATRVLGCKGAAIRLLNPARSEVEFAASYGLSDDYMDKVPVEYRRARLDQDTLAGDALFVNDAPADPRIWQPERAEEGRHRVDAERAARRAPRAARRRCARTAARGTSSPRRTRRSSRWSRRRARWRSRTRRPTSCWRS